MPRKAAPGSARTQRIGQLLFVATQAAQALATERLEPLGVTARGWGVLTTILESGPMTQIDLATTMAIDRTAMVYLIDELEAGALVVRVRNPEDRRSFLITLTPAGRALQRRCAVALSGASDALLEPLTAAERQDLTELLGRVVDHWQVR